MAEDRDKIDKIKSSLQKLDQDVKQSKVQWPGEPETKVKATVHRVLTSKFNELLKDNI